MTLNELQKWMLTNDVSDSWWVAIDGEVQDDLMTLPDVGKTKDQHPVALVAVLHESKADEENPEWIPFQKGDGARFKVVSSRFDNLQVRVPAGAEKSASELPDKQGIEPNEAADAQSSTPQAPAELKEDAERAGEALPPADNTGIHKELSEVKTELAALKAEVESLRSLADQLKQPILEAQKVLEERERFLEMSETSLFDKAQKQEVLQTELEQLSEELHDRESALKDREAAVS